MARIQRSPTELRVRSARRISVLTCLALVGLVAIAIMVEQFATASPEVFAAPAQAKNEPWLKIKCLDTEVVEGDDFRLEVRAKYDTDAFSPTIQVFWYTVPITADASDYEHQYAEGQASNAYQSRTGKMGRDFHTLEDLYPEASETFKVRFNNSVDHGHDGECIITITDDDGVGIYDLEITSTPHQLPADDGQQPQVGYAAGDVIEITAHFTGDVTTVNPATGQQSDYAGIYVFVGNQRRVAPLLRSYGSDALVFGYTVKPDDLDTDGISVEAGGLPLIGPSTPTITGFRYDRQHRDIGIWPVSPEHDSINRLYHGLKDDPGHRVYQVDIEEPITLDPPPAPEPAPIPDPDPTFTSFEQEILADTNSVVFHQEQHGELTTADEGRDWFSFEANGGENHIIEVKNRWYVSETDSGGPGWAFLYVPGHLIDPSILEIVDREGNQVLGERDWGGFMGLFARAFFTPNEDGTYYVAIGAGAQDRGGLGHYTISVRVDDHADDHRPSPEVPPIQPGGSVTATIDSDVAPDDPGLNPWDWLETSHGNAVPIRGDESLDDRDVFRLEIPQAGTYRVSVSYGPEGVGVWSIMDSIGHAEHYQDTVPAPSMEFHGEPGVYYTEIGTPYRSEGNTGTYKVTLEAIGD